MKYTNISRVGPLFLVMLSTLAFAQGSSTAGNGGGENEPNFKQIASNIEAWIQCGNSNDLRLPNGITHYEYKSRMLRSLSNYHISFTVDRIFVRGQEKTCKNIQQRNQIICNARAFSESYKTDIDNTYRLVHHEFAGLAGLEENRGVDSDYAISNDISAFLEIENTKRLPIVRKQSTNHLLKSEPNFCSVEVRRVSNRGYGNWTKALFNCGKKDIFEIKVTNRKNRTVNDVIADVMHQKGMIFKSSLNDKAIYMNKKLDQTKGICYAEVKYQYNPSSIYNRPHYKISGYSVACSDPTIANSFTVGQIRDLSFKQSYPYDQAELQLTKDRLFKALSSIDYEFGQNFRFERIKQQGRISYFNDGNVFAGFVFIQK